MGESPEQNQNATVYSSIASYDLSKAKRILSGEETTTEFEAYSNAMHALDEYIRAGDRYGAGDASQEEQLKILAKDPDGLKLLDESNKAIAKVFSALSQLVIKALDIQPNPEQAKLVASSKTISALLINTKPVLGIPLEDFKGVKPIIYIDGGEQQDENILRFNLLKSAIACHLSGLPEQSAMFFDQLWGKVMGQESPHNNSVRDQILKVKGSIEHFSKAGYKGNQSRHERSNKTKLEAIKLYHSGSFKNPSQAAQKLFPQVKAIGDLNGFKFASDFNGQRTLYNWFLAEQKNTSSQ